MPLTEPCRNTAPYRLFSKVCRGADPARDKPVDHTVLESREQGRCKVVRGEEQMGGSLLYIIMSYGACGS